MSTDETRPHSETRETADALAAIVILAGRVERLERQVETLLAGAERAGWIDTTGHGD